jgi:hypothetical protein
LRLFPPLCGFGLFPKSFWLRLCRSMSPFASLRPRTASEGLRSGNPTFRSVHAGRTRASDR